MQIYCDQWGMVAAIQIIGKFYAFSQEIKQETKIAFS